MGMIDYVKTPFMACPTCGADVGWESRTRDRPQCEDVTVAELLEQRHHVDRDCGYAIMTMVGDCVRCNYFIEVRVHDQIIIDGECEDSPQRAITA